VATGLTPNVEVVLYAGEVGGVFAFGLSPDNLTSPGPTLKFKLGDTIKITLVNVGRIPHTFAVTDRPEEGATILFNSEIGSVSNPVQPGSEQSLVFVANQVGEFSYICTVPGHVALGMKGKVIIEG
jgi:nitrite reductase (NO-forming)